MHVHFLMREPVLDLSGVGGFNPLLVPLTPQVCIDPPKKIVKISEKYIADPPLVFPQIEYWRDWKYQAMRYGYIDLGFIHSF